MIYIQKGETPAVLRKYQSDPEAAFSSVSGTDKQTIRECLVSEQKALCAYCMKRISPGSSEMKIEHYAPQNPVNSTGKGAADRSDLDYNNMLGVCTGGMGLASEVQTCDTKKGNRILKISPLNPQIEQWIHYERTGKIFSENADVQRDLDEILNLNTRSLKEARQTALQRYFRLNGGKHSLDYWKKQKHKVRNSSMPYQEIILYFIEKEIN